MNKVTSFKDSRVNFFKLMTEEPPATYLLGLLMLSDSHYPHSLYVTNNWRGNSVNDYNLLKLHHSGRMCFGDYRIGFKTHSLYPGPHYVQSSGCQKSHELNYS